MCQNCGIRIDRPQIQQAFGLELFVNYACPIPQQHVCACTGLNVAAQMSVRSPDDFLALCSQMLNHIHRDTGSHNPICSRFDGSRSVGIHNHKAIGMSIAKCPKFISRTGHIK